MKKAKKIIYALKHLYKILKHKSYVFYYCCRFHLPIRGFFHDSSKFSPKEFLENINYYTNDKSPIVKCREEKGYSNAWLHHKGRNPHHWEYWVDISVNPYLLPLIPYKYQIEMLCDYLAAGRAYNKNWTPQSELDWWKNHKTKILMNSSNIAFIDNYLLLLVKFDDYEKLLNPKLGKYIYEQCCIKRVKELEPEFYFNKNLW